MRTIKKLILGLTALAAFAWPSGPASADGELYLFNWTNYFPPELIDKFETETGISVTLDNYASEEDMMAKLQAGGGGYDVVFPSQQAVKAMIEQGLAEKIDAHAMPNFKNVAKPHVSISVDPNREYSAPYMWGTTGFTYDSEKVPGGEFEQSWEVYFKPPDELKGKIASLNDVASVYNAAAYYLGVDKCTEDLEEAQQILDLLQAQKPFVKVYSNDGTIDRMIAGEVVMHMQWNGAAHRVKQELPTAVFVYPKEGTGFWSDNMVVPANAPNKDNAKTFINWMMAPENAAAASNFTGYMNAIEGSAAHLDPGLKEDPAVNTPPEYSDRLVPFEDCSAKAQELRNQVWTRLKS